MSGGLPWKSAPTTCKRPASMSNASASIRYRVMSGRDLLLGGALLVATFGTLSSAGFANAQEATTQAMPNVVVMMADNVGYGDIGAYGAGEVRGMPTPRIDHLAGEGLRLTQYLVEPACTPSRAAFMTGRYSQRSGLSTVIVGGHAEHAPGRRGDRRRAVQGEGLRDRHRRQVAPRGAASRAGPPARASTSTMSAFSRRPTAHCIATACSAPGCRRPRSTRPSPTSGNRTESGALKKARPYTLDYRRQVESDIADASVDFIERQSRAKQPFFLYVGFTHTHYPTLTAPEFTGKLPHRRLR